MRQEIDFFSLSSPFVYREREVKRRESVGKAKTSLISRIFGTKSSEARRRGEESDSEEDSASMSALDLETDFTYDSLMFGEGAGVEVEDVKAAPHEELDLTFEDILEADKAGFMPGFRGREERFKTKLAEPSAKDLNMYQE